MMVRPRAREEVPDAVYRVDHVHDAKILVQFADLKRIDRTTSLNP